MNRRQGIAKRCAVLVTALLTLFLAAFILVGCGNAGVGGTSSGPAMGSTNPGNPRDNTPVILQAEQGDHSEDTDKVTVDWSHNDDGYITVRSKLGSTRVKVLLTNDRDPLGGQYQFTIEDTDSFITIPLSTGSGTYAIGVWENITGDSYASIWSKDLEVSITDEIMPFLIPNQFVSFSSGDATAQLSQQATEGATSEIEAINGIYLWVIDNVTYDTVKAENVAPGYLPNNTNTINSQTGICFDYAVLTASMLRAQGIPARLVIGYADAAYHAWMDVYSRESGTVVRYVFDGSGWVYDMDPTFDAATGGANIANLIGTGGNYQRMLLY